MTNGERIIELQSQVVRIEQSLIDCKPSRVTSEDIEDVSDNYQANLEYQWYYDEQMDIIKECEADITYLRSLPVNHTFNDPAVPEIIWNPGHSDHGDLRYVSPEVGYVDQDEEYY